MGSVKDKRFELRLTEQEATALQKLADRTGVSRSNWVALAIMRAAKRKKVW